MIITKIGTESFNIYKQEILKLLVETYRSNFDLTEAQSESICNEKIVQLENYLNEEKAILLIAVDDGLLTGIVWLHKHSYFGEDRLHINQIAVKYNYRGKGIAKQLINEAEKLAVQLNVKAIDLFVSEINSSAVNLYNNLSFETERRYMKKKL